MKFIQTAAHSETDSSGPHGQETLPSKSSRAPSRGEQPWKTTMPDDDASRSEKEDGKREPTTARPNAVGLFTIPAPLKRLFNKFPLITYPANELPLRAQRPRHQHALYVFTTPEGEIAASPSFNPSCLKWQVSTIRRSDRTRSIIANASSSSRPTSDSVT